MRSVGPDSPWRVPFDGSFAVSEAATAPPKGAPGKKQAKKELAALTDEIAELQHALYAEDRHSLLLVFQAMDAAGKDGTIRALLTGVNPAGCQVFSFKQPSSMELDHDFLWRTTRCLPERGRIGVFNRSYYEEVLVVRVHPEYLGGQRLPEPLDVDALWPERFRSIAEHERHLAHNGTAVLKFWLNVSREEQRQRFLARIEEPEKNWKFSSGDVAERGHWDRYMAAYEDALRATSRPWAPWYAIPADDKPFARLQVATIVRDALLAIGPRFPELGGKERGQLESMRAQLEGEG
jgi:PPK2 family polyphosphate:nucleotide phosphotransferase